MDREQAKNYIEAYLKQNFIPYEDRPFDDCFVLQFNGFSHCPDSMLECSIYFKKTCLEALVYYSESAARYISQQKDLSKLFRLLNYINATIYPCAADGADGTLYRARHMFNPRLFLTEDGHNDITYNNLINYDVFELAPLEACDWITAAIPELLDRLSVPIFGAVLGLTSLENAFNMVDNIL